MGIQICKTSDREPTFCQTRKKKSKRINELIRGDSKVISVLLPNFKSQLFLEFFFCGYNINYNEEYQLRCVPCNGQGPAR